MKHWETLVAVAAGVVTFFGASDALSRLVIPAANDWVDERVELQLTGAAKALEKRLETLEQTTKDTNKDLEEVKRRQSEVIGDVKNIKEGVRDIGDDVDRILDRLIAAPHR